MFPHAPARLAAILALLPVGGQAAQVDGSGPLTDLVPRASLEMQSLPTAIGLGGGLAYRADIIDGEFVVTPLELPALAVAEPGPLSVALPEPASRAHSDRLGWVVWSEGEGGRPESAWRVAVALAEADDAAEPTPELVVEALPELPEGTTAVRGDGLETFALVDGDGPGLAIALLAQRDGAALWFETTALPIPIADFGLMLMDDRIIVAGGIESDTEARNAQAWSFDLESDAAPAWEPGVFPVAPAPGAARAVSGLGIAAFVLPVAGQAGASQGQFTVIRPAGGVGVWTPFRMVDPLRADALIAVDPSGAFWATAHIGTFGLPYLDLYPFPAIADPRVDPDEGIEQAIAQRRRSILLDYDTATSRARRERRHHLAIIGDAGDEAYDAFVNRLLLTENARIILQGILLSEPWGARAEELKTRFHDEDAPGGPILVLFSPTGEVVSTHQGPVAASDLARIARPLFEPVP